MIDGKKEVQCWIYLPIVAGVIWVETLSKESTILSRAPERS